MPYSSEVNVSAMLTADAGIGDCESLLTYDLLQNGNASGQIRPIHHEWWQQAKGMLSRGQHQKPFLPSALDDVVGRIQDIESPDEPGSANRPHLSRPTCDAIEPLSEPRTVFADVFQQRRVRESVKHIICDRCYERTASERRTMITRLDRGTDLLRNQNGSHRQTSRQRLGESQHVRHYSCVLVSEKVARAAEATLDFIENESD